MKIYLPGCASLKEKRTRLSPLLAKIRRDFNVSVSELDYQDIWQTALLGCAMVASDATVVRQGLQAVARWMDECGADIQLEEEKIEFR